VGQGSAADIADRARGVGLDADVVAALRAQLPDVAERTIAAVIAEVPQYADGLSDEMAAGIAAGVQMALAAFLRLASGTQEQEPTAVLDAAVAGAYDLGRTEARSGRTMDALLSAYRVGARVAWHDLAETAVDRGIRAASVVDFAALVFAYIDELSAASVAGHSAERASRGRVRARHLNELGQALLAGEPPDLLVARADRADWPPPRTLTAVLVPVARVHDVVASLDQRTLVLTDDLAGGAIPPETAALLVPDVDRHRTTLLEVLQGRPAVVGPARPWTTAAASFQRAVRTLEIAPLEASTVVDTDEHLTSLVLRADPGALADLRHQALAPMSGLRAATAERLAQTLRSWLLHRGRRSAVAEDLVIHPQTVRYRMGQLRGLYGDRLDDPEVVLALILALALDTRGEGTDPR
jgi:DNA-binding PucR family transcriptional regulator